MNDHMNQVLRGNTLCSDGEDHNRLRRVIMKPLTPSALNSLQERVTAEADELVQRLVSQGSCATRDLAAHLPISVVSNEVGLAEEGRERMLVWADKMFDCFGPEDDRTRQAWPVLDEMMRYATTQAVRGKVKPGSWAEAVLDAADRDEVDRSLCPVLMIDYMGPSLDTKSSSARFPSRMQARCASRCRPVACATAMCSRKKASARDSVSPRSRARSRGDHR